MPLTSITRDPVLLTLTVVGEYVAPQQALWDAFADPRKLERFWGPPDAPATFTRHDFTTGGRAEYFMTGPHGERWDGSWRFTAVDPISSFEAYDGDDNVDDEDMPWSMSVTFATTTAGSRVSIVLRFSSIEALEKTAPGMTEGFSAAWTALDSVLAEP